MASLLLALMLCLLLEAGGPAPALLRGLRARYGASFAVIPAMVLALALLSVLGAELGALLSLSLTPEARLLFFAIALAAGGLSLLMPGKKGGRPVPEWRMGALIGSFLVFFVVGLGGAASFLVAGIASSRAYPVLAGIGGAIGSIAGCLIGAAISERLPDRAFLIALRAVGAGLIFCSVLMALSAMRII